MSNLLASLQNSASALKAYDQVLQVTQNNVANASTPGYARQTVRLEAMPLDLRFGAMGGVRAGTVQSSRDQYAEQAVRSQTVGLGQAQQLVSSLTNLQSLFDISGTSGISAAMNQFLQNVSAWGQSPADSTARQNVIDSATEIATSFNQAASGLANFAQDTRGQLTQTVTHVNGLLSTLQGLNTRILAGARNDPAVDAQMTSTLEDLSQYVDFTAMQQADGSMTVLMNGQTPLVVADQAYNLRAGFQQPSPTDPYPDGPTSAHLFSSDGRDITANTSGGQLGALLKVYNQTLPSYIGDATHAGDLNTMAEQFANRVNQILTSGDVTDGATPQAGVALFQFGDATSHTRMAASLAVDPTVTADQLGAIAPGPPAVANGIPLALSALASPSQDQDMVGGMSFSAFYGAMAARVGSGLNDATSQMQTQQSTVAQAKDLRQQVSGVSLDEEATVMIQFQRAYEANSRLLTILDQLTQDTINIIRP